MKRNVIRIDDEKCTGCGVCVPDCPEGAIQIINGKARLVSDFFCDGLGACIGRCPEGAISVEKREAEPYDETRVMENVARGGPDVIGAHLKHLKDHGQDRYVDEALKFLHDRGMPVPRSEETPAGATAPGPKHVGGMHRQGHGACPGSRMVDMRKENPEGRARSSGPAPSELGQWPVQLQLVNPTAPYFQDADLVIAADCVPFAFGDFHRRFLKGKILIIFCPKLDRMPDEYVDKLSEIFAHNAVRSISLVHMEVPCCFGLKGLVEEAVRRSGNGIPVEDHTISIKGEVL
jgi:NAD-dependent dihydropyrimidine dehydrogenase PreA subunit